MLIYPHINSLLDKVDSRYTLVTLTAKRARQLNDGAEKLIDCSGEKSVTVAINEINLNKITYFKDK